MAYEDFQTKQSVVIVYTGENKGKTSASLGLSLRALGQDDWRVAFVQFIKTWPVGEHKVLKKLAEVYDGRLSLVVGGKGFYNAGEVSAKNVSEDEHKKAARETYEQAKKMASCGDYNLVVCDEILNAVHDGLLSQDHPSSCATLHTKSDYIILKFNNLYPYWPKTYRRSDA